MLHHHLQLNLSAFTEQKKGLHDYMFSKYRCALVLDECHHLADTGDQPFTEAIKPLREAAVITMVMTGTADRQDRKQIYGLNYNKDASSQLYKPSCDIIYSRSDAVGEGAKFPITFHVGWRLDLRRKRTALTSKLRNPR